MRMWWIIGEISFIVLGILILLVLVIFTNRLEKESDLFGGLEGKFLKSFRDQYFYYIQQKKGFENEEVFLEKYIQGIGFKKLSLESWYHLAGQCILSSVFLAGMGACYRIIEGDTIGQLLPLYGVSFLGLYLYFTAIGMLNIKKRKEHIKTNLKLVMEEEKTIYEKRPFGQEEEAELTALLQEFLA
ncbi:MAG: hypothetical protein MJ134_02940 [Lachnospiraceae bacterium]|nr:hypothetical protein [Lachnospiraceae bacterium]